MAVAVEAARAEKASAGWYRGQGATVAMESARAEAALGASAGW